MPIPFYNLHDRTAEELSAEMIAQIPAHTPDWRNPRPGDPGRALIDLFAWMGDKILYRVNLLPERQRLAFLRLLNMPMKPARPSRGLLALSHANPTDARRVTLTDRTLVPGPVEFETAGEITVAPFESRCYVKRRTTDAEAATLTRVQQELERVYELAGSTPYVSTPLFTNGRSDPAGVDIAAEAVDQTLWIALLARDPAPEVIAAARESLTREANGVMILNVGLAPREEVDETEIDPLSSEVIAESWLWEMPLPGADDAPVSASPPRYAALPVSGGDTTDGFRRRGVVRLLAPDESDVGLPENNPDIDTLAGVGDRPPRIDDPVLAARLVTWLRLRPKAGATTLPLSWVGLNAVEIEQQRTIRNAVIGASDATPDQQFQLPAASVDPESLLVEVQRADGVYEFWSRVDDLFLHGRDDKVLQLDAEAGVIAFGDGVRGAVPPQGARIRIAQARHGGGRAGDLAAGSIKAVAHPRLAARQPVATEGGEDAETLDAAEKRIPSALRHRDRAVTEQDYEDLAMETPGVSLGRVHVMPRFRPFQRLSDVPGVVTVQVVPQPRVLKFPHPRADRSLIQQVHDQLDQRRLVGTEMYVVGTDYVPVSVSVSIGLRSGYAADKVTAAVDEALRVFLFPTAPGGREGEGWAFGQSISNLELEVIAARVPGVASVFGLNIFSQDGELWRIAPRLGGQPAQVIAMESWQLPELQEVLAVVDEPEAPSDPTTEGGGGGLDLQPIPVVPEVC